MVITNSVNTYWPSTAVCSKLMTSPKFLQTCQNLSARHYRCGDCYVIGKKTVSNYGLTHLGVCSESYDIEKSDFWSCIHNPFSWFPKMQCFRRKGAQTMLIGVRAKTQFCFMLLLISKGSDIRSLKWTAALIPSWKDLKEDGPELAWGPLMFPVATKIMSWIRFPQCSPCDQRCAQSIFKRPYEFLMFPLMLYLRRIIVWFA